MTYNLKINMEFQPYMIEKIEIIEGVQYIFRFPNNYGASIVKYTGTYGYFEDLWEMALIFFDEDGDWELTYENDFYDDVIGYLTDEEVNSLLGKIMSY